MTDEHGSHLTEEQAAQLWQRAAVLQAEASRAAESRSAGEAGSAIVPRAGYELEHVRAAAIEAGIGAEYLDAALADMRAEEAIQPAKKKGPFVRFFLGDDPPDAITVRRVINASPKAVLKAMEEVVPNDPYKLALKDRRGDPLNGGLLVFDIVGASFVATEGFAAQAAAADLREVYVSIRPLDDGAASEVTVRGPVAWAHTMNSWGGGFLVGLGTTAGGVLGWLGGTLASTALIGSGVGAGVAAGAAAVTAAGSVLGSGWLSMRGFRWTYRYSLGKGEQGIDGLLGVITVHAQGGWSLPTGDSDPPKAIGEGDDDEGLGLFGPG